MRQASFALFAAASMGLLLIAAWAPAISHAQQPGPAGIEATGVPPARAASAPVRSGSGAGATARVKSPTSPPWIELTPPQQQALGPLAATWSTISEAQKRKWLVLSKNFVSLSADEQAKLHSRMTEWAALSPQQRTLARLNFARTQRLSSDDKKAKWEAYQALPPEEKSKLAASAAKPPAAAAAVKPVPARKLATMTQPGGVSTKGQVDNNTLLPQSAPPAAPASSR